MGWLICKRVFVADPVFGGLDRNTQKLIAANMTPLHLLPGHTLCQQGAVADRVWLLQEGVSRPSGFQVYAASHPALTSGCHGLPPSPASVYVRPPLLPVCIS